MYTYMHTYIYIHAHIYTYTYKHGCLYTLIDLLKVISRFCTGGFVRREMSF